MLKTAEMVEALPAESLPDPHTDQAIPMAIPMVIPMVVPMSIPEGIPRTTPMAIRNAKGQIRLRWSKLFKPKSY